MLVPWALGFVIVFGLPRFIPAGPVRSRHAWPAALVVAGLYVAAEHLFALYVGNFAHYNVVYGSLGAIVAFMFFVYLAAMLLLPGAEVTSEWPRAVRDFERGEVAEGPPFAVQAREFMRGLWVRERMRESAAADGRSADRGSGGDETTGNTSAMSEPTEAPQPRTTPPVDPPMDPDTDEATARQLEAARAQGRAYGEALALMTGEVAEDGGEQRAGEYLVGYAVEEAEGMYAWRDGELAWSDPGERNLHVEVSVRDAGDGRFVPGVTVTATLITPDGEELGPHEQPLLWHPMIYHYGRNWELPSDGDYRLRVRVEPPTFPRHDRVNGCRFREPVEAEFHPVRVRRGRD